MFLNNPTMPLRAPDINDRQPARLLGNGVESKEQGISPDQQGRARQNYLQDSPDR
jgi:hypothetical protein